jgi:hypothetical protein
MYERYEAKFHWYELTQLVQKTVFVLVMIFLLLDPVLQVGVSRIISSYSAMIPSPSVPLKSSICL